MQPTTLLMLGVLALAGPVLASDHAPPPDPGLHGQAFTGWSDEATSTNQPEQASSFDQAFTVWLSDKPIDLEAMRIRIEPQPETILCALHEADQTIAAEPAAELAIRPDDTGPSIDPPDALVFAQDWLHRSIVALIAGTDHGTAGGLARQRS